MVAFVVGVIIIIIIIIITIIITTDSDRSEFFAVPRKNHPRRSATRKRLAEYLAKGGAMLLVTHDSHAAERAQRVLELSAPAAKDNL